MGPVSFLIVTVDTLNKEMALVGVGDFSRQCEISRSHVDSCNDDLFVAGCCYKRGTGFCCLATLVLGCVVLVLGVVLLISGRVRLF